MTIHDVLTETLPTWFANTSIGQKMEQQKAADRQADREANAREITTLRKRKDRELPPLDKRAKATATAMEEATAVLKEATAADGDACRAAQSLSTVLDGKISRCEWALIETAPEVIDTFIEELQAELDTLRRDPPFAREGDMGIDGLVATHTNTPSVKKRTLGFMAAIRAAVELKVEVLSDDALHTRIEKIRAGIPEIKMELIS